MGEVGEDLVDLLFVFGISEQERKKENKRKKGNNILAAIMVGGVLLHTFQRGYRTAGITAATWRLRVALLSTSITNKLARGVGDGVCENGEGH